MYQRILPYSQLFCYAPRPHFHLGHDQSKRLQDLAHLRFRLWPFQHKCQFFFCFFFLPSFLLPSSFLPELAQWPTSKVYGSGSCDSQVCQVWVCLKYKPSKPSQPTKSLQRWQRQCGQTQQRSTKNHPI